MEETQFDVIDSKSDHSAMLSDLVIRKQKLLIGVLCMEQDGFSDDMKELMLKNGIGQTEVVKEISDLPEKFCKFTNVIVVCKDLIALLPSFDFLFHVDSSIDLKIEGTLHRNLYEVSSAEEAFEKIRNYLIC